MKIRTVHVVFKTHLDIGFTDLAKSVIDHYVHRFIPAAIETAKEANRAGAPRRFVWTVGSYLVDYALRTLGGEALSRLEEAIKRGDVAYHALPFTAHCELCGEEIFSAGLGIAKRLDARFDKKTISAKMTDVPGHTVGIVAPMAESGIEYLHVGINNVACLAELPPLFVFEDTQRRQIIVNYTRSYGGVTTVDGHDEALYFLHGNDNMGPPSIGHLSAAFEKIQRRFPGAQIIGSTMDAFAAGLAPLKASLPVIRDEIGDTWIHGVGSDPAKTAMLRAMERLSRAWDRDGTWNRHQTPAQDGRLPREAFLETLLLVCEHTWGLDTKKYLTDFTNWNRADFDAARRIDALPDRYGQRTKYEKAFQFAKKEFLKLKPDAIEWEQRSYSLFESSHQEQRDYIQNAVALLPAPLQRQARAALEKTLAGIEFPPEAKGLVDEARVGDYRAELRGAEIELTAPGGVRLLLGLPFYQEVGTAAFDRLIGHYLDHIEENEIWAIPDNGKPGLEDSDAPKTDVNHFPAVDTVAMAGDRLLIEGHFDEQAHEKAGCPRRMRMEIAPLGEDIMVTVHLLEKPANRKPEALYVKLEMPQAERVLLRKIGQWVDPSRCVPKGNQRVHGVQAIKWKTRAQKETEILPLDTPLVCLGAPTPLEFEGVETHKKLYLNLYNNLWGTNFKMWYDEDIVCRFIIKKTMESKE